MAGLDQALSGLASGQLQAIVAAAQSKLQAVPTTGSTSASAAVDVAVHDTKILFPTVFSMLPDMSNGRFPHPDSELARVEPGLGWLTDITARYLFKRTLYIWKQEAGRCHVDRSDRVSVGDDSTVIFRLAGLERC